MFDQSSPTCVGDGLGDELGWVLLVTRVKGWVLLVTVDQSTSTVSFGGVLKSRSMNST